MRREDRMSVAAMDRMSGMRREDRMSVAAMDRMSCMRREGAPVWMHAYRDVGGRRRREQAVEDVRSRPANAAIHASKSLTGVIP